LENNTLIAGIMGRAGSDDAAVPRPAPIGGDSGTALPAKRKDSRSRPEIVGKLFERARGDIDRQLGARLASTGSGFAGPADMGGAQAGRRGGLEVGTMRRHHHA